jgi:hypothetical protein
MNETMKKRLFRLEQKSPRLEDEGLPIGTSVQGFEWVHKNPEICRVLPKRGYCGEKAKIFAYNPADCIEIFDGKSNLKLIKCGWCSDFLKDCDGASYLKFDLESIREKSST